jgi:cation diffusion facilitator family transporter
MASDRSTDHIQGNERRAPRDETQTGSKKVIYAAIAANAGIALSKFVVAGVTGSAAMLAEGIHSAVDTCNEFLLLLGIRHSNRPADEWHPFGYGKVLYFWALIVALSVFSLGGGISIYQGILSLRDPPALHDPFWNYVVLAVAAVFEGCSWHVSRKELQAHRRPGDSLWKTVRRSKDPSVFTVFIEDSAALLGIAIAAAGIWLGHALDNHYIDPAASVLIGLVLIAASFVLAQETGGLLVGESIDREQIVQVKKILSSDPMVEQLGHLLSMQLGPDQVLLIAAVRFKRGLSIGEVDQVIDRLEHAVTQQCPAIQRIYFEAEPVHRRAGFVR